MEVTDPVCGMKFDFERTTAMAERDGRAHFFWSAERHSTSRRTPSTTSLKAHARPLVAQHRHQTAGGEDE